MYGLPQTSVNWAFCEAEPNFAEARQTLGLQKSQAFSQLLERVK